MAPIYITKIKILLIGLT